MEEERKSNQLKKEKEGLIRRWMGLQDEAEGLNERIYSVAVEIETLNARIEQELEKERREHEKKIREAARNGQPTPQSK